MDGRQITLGSACHHNEPVAINPVRAATAAQHQTGKAHNTPIGKLHMPWCLWGRPFVPATGRNDAAARCKGIAKGGLFGDCFHAGIDQQVAPLPGWWQTPAGRYSLGLQSGLANDQRRLRRRHIPARLQILQNRYTKQAHQLFR